MGIIRLKKSEPNGRHGSYERLPHRRVTKPISPQHLTRPMGGIGTRDGSFQEAVQDWDLALLTMLRLQLPKTEWPVSVDGHVAAGTWDRTTACGDGVRDPDVHMFAPSLNDFADGLELLCLLCVRLLVVRLRP